MKYYLHTVGSDLAKKRWVVRRVSRTNFYKNSSWQLAPLSGTRSFRLKFLWSCLPCTRD